MLDPQSALVLCRGAIFMSSIMIWGASVFRWRLLSGAARMRFETWMVVILVTTVGLLLPVQVARIAGAWEDAGDPCPTLSRRKRCQ